MVAGIDMPCTQQRCRNGIIMCRLIVAVFVIGRGSIAVVLPPSCTMDTNYIGIGDRMSGHGGLGWVIDDIAVGCSWWGNGDF